MSDEQVFLKALEGKNIPILTLDHNWHRLFSQSRTTPEIQKLEEKVNSLLKEQGRVNTELREINALKKSLMDKIVTKTDELQSGNQASDKEIEDNKRLINECNEKMEKLRDDQMDLPREINKANLELMIASMEACRERFSENQEEMAKIESWIRGIKVELRQKIVKKQDREIDNYGLFMFMQSFFGDETRALFDMKYDPSVNPPKLKK
ncbi:MAG: hypothetical protein IJ589_11170 [Lachnospiraceae bacterium]|nr:hypothetical protein [Lachnospiraceae bacterium]